MAQKRIYSWTTTRQRPKGALTKEMQHLTVRKSLHDGLMTSEDKHRSEEGIEEKIVRSTNVEKNPQCMKSFKLLSELNGSAVLSKVNRK